MTRPGPQEDAVRDALKTQEAAGNGADAKDDDSGNDGGTDAAVEAESPPEPEVAQAEAEPEAAEPVAEEDELTVVKRERDEYLDLAKRTQADFENYRKRSAKDATVAGNRARTGLIREILPAVDNLERALGAAPEGEGDAFVQGVRLVLVDLQGALQRAGVEPIEPKGDVFDPNVHEALSVRPEEGAQSGTVLDVVEKGYRTADMVIRPARVVVAG